MYPDSCSRLKGIRISVSISLLVDIIHYFNISLEISFFFSAESILERILYTSWLR